MSLTAERAGASATRPFHVDIPAEALEDLRRRVAAARLPSQELVADRSQGVQLATIQALARYWATGHDWRRCEAELNPLPQFKTQIDGLDVHFIHVRSRHENALPLIITHGWPGSVIELLGVVGPSRTRPRTADAPRTRSISCCRPCPATASPARRQRSVGIRAASREPGRS
jgi:hypothetical protein